MFFRVLIGTLWLGASVLAQTVQPVIVEYKGKADGKLMLTNNTLSPMVVILEPKSFSITPEGKGQFRPLDSNIHVQLSSMSVRLQPKQTYYVFYKATADKLPAWFTVYATFSNPRHSDGLDVRIMLPHTVYLYQKQPLTASEVQVKNLSYSVGTRRLSCDIENDGDALARVQSVKATGDHANGDLAGFPLLPGGSRHIEMDWPESQSPTEIDFRFEHFDLKRPITGSTQ
ncbi:fimbrial biogenesis chaperone [Tunturiibacter lichenicola]|uniref:hypothetical protein n=1 Tax=Tunturiibacter lichenicola TaxID=2051959 RepID=UPI0021B3E6F0|nr:hypothetical protein [Edaphobacter lichenicola]